jgi:hypothetical protein
VYLSLRDRQTDREQNMFIESVCVIHTESDRDRLSEIAEIVKFVRYCMFSYENVCVCEGESKRTKCLLYIKSVC